MLSQKYKKYLPKQKIEIDYNGFSFILEAAPFWSELFLKWEMDTKRIYQLYCRPDKFVLDIGAWIGPTVLIAFAHNAGHIYAVEGDPRNAHTLKRNCFNNLLQDRVTIFNSCIYSKSDELMNFGDSVHGASDPVEDSSVRSFGGNFKVQSTTLVDLIKTKNLAMGNCCLLKIDIEGSELYLYKDLAKLAPEMSPPVLLSLHQPFWHKFTDADPSICFLTEYYNFYTVDNVLITAEELQAYIDDGKNKFCSLILKSKIFDN